MMVDSEVRFVADINGSPAPKITWTKDDQVIQIDANHVIESDGASQILIIKNVKINDEGKYRVVAQNSLGQVESTGQLVVLEQPIIDQAFGDISQSAGTDVTLTCKVVGGRPKPTITWLRNGKEFKGDDRHVITSSIDEGIYQMVIKSLDETENQAKYTLIAKNKVGQKELNSTVTVQAALEFIQPLKDQDVLAQSPCTMTVETNGIPKPTVKW